MLENIVYGIGFALVVHVIIVDRWSKGADMRLKAQETKNAELMQWVDRLKRDIAQLERELEDVAGRLRSR